jgi:feruloyl esterase
MPICRVVAVAEPAIKFEIWMPATAWNGKFNGVGNGGYAGFINYGAMRTALARGYATASTDTGHMGNPFDATWMLGHPELVVDHLDRSIHEMTVQSKRIVRAFYGDKPRRSYFTGCSAGGNQGLIEAQRYPRDYDGIVAGAPAPKVTRLHAWFTWSAQATLKTPANYLPASKLQLIADAVNARCDALDGIVDGLLDDPRRCAFDPVVLQCPGADAPNCLTADQAHTVEQLYAGPRNPRTGEQLFPGAVPGGETGPGGWGQWITGPAPGASLHAILAGGLFRYAGFEDPSWDWRTFDFDADFTFMSHKLGPTWDASDANFSRFQARGGKIIMYHGWSDPAISPLNSIDYYQRVTDAARRDAYRAHHDGDDGREETREFFRFFLAPGLQHCGGGPGPNTFDALGALEKWVEQGKAPRRIVATGGIVPTRTRPLCPYPQTAQYLGRGSTDDAASFDCQGPLGDGNDDDGGGHGHDRNHDED